MSLTPKQEQFAQLVASGKSQADAYRGAYNVSETTKAETIQKRASELMANGVVSGRVDQLKEQLASKALWTREESVKALRTVLDNDPASNVAVSAIKELNLMHGFNAPSKLEITGGLDVVTKVEMVVIKPDGNAKN